MLVFTLRIVHIWKARLTGVCCVSIQVIVCLISDVTEALAISCCVVCFFCHKTVFVVMNVTGSCTYIIVKTWAHTKMLFDLLRQIHKMLLFCDEMNRKHLSTSQLSVHWLDMDLSHPLYLLNKVSMNVCCLKWSFLSELNHQDIMIYLILIRTQPDLCIFECYHGHEISLNGVFFFLLSDCLKSLIYLSFCLRQTSLALFLERHNVYQFFLKTVFLYTYCRQLEAFVNISHTAKTLFQHTPRVYVYRGMNIFVPYGHKWCLIVQFMVVYEHSLHCACVLYCMYYGVRLFSMQSDPWKISSDNSGIMCSSELFHSTNEVKKGMHVWILQR